MLENVNIDEKFLGLTLFALIPSVTEFYNAIAFAMQGNIVLALEIGGAYTIQVALLQIPGMCKKGNICVALVAFSAWFTPVSTIIPHGPIDFPYPGSQVISLFSGIWADSYPETTVAGFTPFTLIFPVCSL